MHDGTDTANKPARAKTTTVGCRYPDDRIHLLDAVTKRRGDGDRSDTIRYALDQLIEEHFPGATGEAA